MGMGTTIGAGGDVGVLEDPSGRRARLLRWMGRVVFLVFLVWLVAIVLGGLGLAPVPGIPFVRALHPSGPPPVARLPHVRQPAPADLRPALPASAVVTSSKPTHAAPVAAHGKSAVAPGRTKTVPPGVTHGHSATAPGRTKTAPGQTKTTPSHGHVRTTTTHGKP
jgi:hypothetical protein